MGFQRIRSNSAMGMLWIMLFLINCTHSEVLEEVEKITVSEPEASPGCPIPDLRYSRPRKIDTGAATEMPGASVEVTQTLLNTDQPDASNANGDMAELTSDREVVRHSRYIDFDPYASWTDDKKAEVTVNANLKAHTIQRRKIRSRVRDATSIDSTDSSHKTSSVKHQANRQPRETYHSFEIGTNLSVRNETKEIDESPSNDTSGRRVKRKSGKTTGALSRPKGASDSGSKSTSRKKEGATVDEEGQYIVHAVDDTEDEEEEEEEEDTEEHDHFGEVTEVRFPAEVGAVGERKLCRIRCVHGKWVGPICATKDEIEVTSLE